jgi:hypothetical protein
MYPKLTQIFRGLNSESHAYRQVGKPVEQSIESGELQIAPTQIMAGPNCSVG